jgi:hypothetical protein
MIETILLFLSFKSLNSFKVHFVLKNFLKHFHFPNFFFHLDYAFPKFFNFLFQTFIFSLCVIRRCLQLKQLNSSF